MTDLGAKHRDLRATFDRVADLYDRARPTYPKSLFDDIVALSGVPAGGRVLEIGCGTGQATRPMAERGYQIVAVELGPNLAAVARRNLALFDNVDVQTGAFEDWSPPDEPFDLVMSVTAFHWLDKSIALPKIAALLRPGGALAIASGGHVDGGTAQFFADAQRCYEAHDPEVEEGIQLQPADDVPVPAVGIDEPGLFGPLTHRRSVWTRDFTTAAYIDELQTYSGMIALPDDARAALLACIARLIDEKYHGRITKAYLQDLQVARRL